MYDDGYDCIISSDGLMSFHHYHDDGDLFTFAHLVFAKEIDTIFVVNIYGFNYHSFADEREFFDIDGLDENEHCFAHQDLGNYLMEWYPSYKHVAYGVDNLIVASERYKESISKQAPILANVLPSLAVGAILKNQVPVWTLENEFVQAADIKAMFSLDPENHQAAFGWFHETSPDVSVYIDASA